MENVKLQIPLKSEYVLVARLTSSGIATRMGIDLEKLEDIKVVISEVLNLCIYEKANENMLIEFGFDEEILNIVFSAKDIGVFLDEENEFDLGISIIKALTDEFKCFSDKSKIIVQFRL